MALVGCGPGVDSYVKDYEGAVEVKACHKVSDAITDDEDYVLVQGEITDNEDYGFILGEVWKCAIKLDGTPGFLDACYVVYENIDGYFISQKLRCVSVGPGCPSGGLRDREAQTVLLGGIDDVDLAFEASLGNVPAYETVRVEVFSQETEGAKEHCGYLRVRVPIADDVNDPSQKPTALAAKVIETEWTDPNYSFSYHLIDD